MLINPVTIRRNVLRISFGGLALSCVPVKVVVLPSCYRATKHNKEKRRYIPNTAVRSISRFVKKGSAAQSE
jgi:hypothetical protein